jgi:hypothetical protein
MDSPIFSDDAKELLTNNNAERFRQRFGDCFISGLKKGGEYFAIYQISGSDSDERDSLSVDIDAAFNGLVTSAELKTSIQSKTQNSKHHLEVRVHVFRQGAIQEADLNVEDILKTARSFPVSVAGTNAYPYAVSLQDYNVLKNPNDRFNFIDIENQQAVLEDLAKRRFAFLTRRNDISYILGHLDDFQNSDGSPVVREAMTKLYDDIVDAINAMQQQASACSKDARQCNFTKFEISKYPVPVAKAGRLAPPPTPAPTLPGPLAISESLGGVLLAAGWRSMADVQTMSLEDQRNTVIVELSKHANMPVPYFQGLDNDALIEKGAVTVFLLKAGIRDALALQAMTDDDQRNTLIVEDAGHTGTAGPVLQGMNDLQLVRVGLDWFNRGRRASASAA